MTAGLFEAWFAMVRGVEAVHESEPGLWDAGIHFACHTCGSVLSVPEETAGVSGPCPLCGEWLESPGAESVRVGRRRMGNFVSRRPRLPDVALVGLPKLRPEGRINWRERRDRCDKVVSWFQRTQGRLCAAALFFAAVLVAFLHSHGWNLPWNLSEDSSVVRFLETFRKPIEGPGLPTAPPPPIQ